MTARRRILALGGHDFDRRAGNDAICDLIVELADSPRPKVCLLPTASGDPEDQILRFRRAFAERDCVPQAISLFRLGENPVDLREELLGHDVI
jgi:dipeptidase E